MGIGCLTTSMIWWRLNDGGGGRCLESSSYCRKILNFRLGTVDFGRRQWAPNGRIPNNMRIACSIRYFAGGAVYDILAQFGISEASFYRSIDMVIEAVNTCPQFELRYPANVETQHDIAQGFKRKSHAGFDCCAGAIDGLLIWITKPSKKQCTVSRQGQTKYFCGRKSKYGLNMQAVVDYNARFLDVSIMYGGASSDLLAFEASQLHGDLKDGSLLAPGLCLFGDNAYVNTPFMATPYPATGNFTRERDAYNFYHSQLRIISEGGFGRLINRWGFLQKKVPQHYTIAKTIATVICLCRLHNYCTSASIAQRERLDPPQAMEEDRITIRLNGGVTLQRLLGGGEHNDGVHRHVLRTNRRRQLRVEPQLPRERLCAQVTERNLHRPPPRP